MEFKDLQLLIKLISKSELTEFKMKEKDFELSIRTKDYQKVVRRSEGNYIPVQQPVQVQPAAPVNIETAPVEPVITEKMPVAKEEEALPTNLIEVKSPIVGTFYRSSSPDKPPYIKVGDTIEVGSVVCIVEAMKLFNEIESEVSGKVVKVMVEDATPVEYDQVLFLVEPA